ncbi:hypothetical protein GCK72_007999 [Caenorhabditis remanei]|uniref:F-box domain-containing protein n=1 Tax=Caenorhabditis remanei TaxID=31234 RepID=A0A6A5HJI4_CAERE|nr:hypothetical protein GCK72_007999 [Caenorhabditis remanei]KAF1768038.1 hypothetical protein GCK72_007999 [Caenorhabditis remanei]
MPPPLSYPALKLVLEYLDVKKRYHITSRSSALQKIDKKIPLRVGTLIIWKDSSVSLDDLEYSAEYTKRKINREELLKIHVVNEKLKKYLEERPNIHVDHVGIYSVKFYEEVPLKLNLIANKLHTFCCSDFRNFLPMIDSRSFPLKKLKLTEEESIDVDHPVVHTAQDVILQFSQKNRLIRGIEKLQRKKLTIQNIMNGNVDAVRIIKDWVKNGREIGTEYLLCFFSNAWIQRMLRDLKNEFHEFQNNLKGVNVRFLKRAPRFSIPMNPISKIIIYGTEIQSKDDTVYQLVLKVVSTDE